MKKLILVLGVLIFLLGVACCAQEETPLGQKTTPSAVEPTEYGIPPNESTPPETRVPEDYPYTGELLPGLEGKVQLAYNYVVDFSGNVSNVSVKMKFTNFSKATVEYVRIEYFMEDIDGKILNFGGTVGVNIKPEESWYSETPGNIEINYDVVKLTPPVDILLKISYLKFE